MYGRLKLTLLNVHVSHLVLARKNGGAMRQLI